MSFGSILKTVGQDLFLAMRVATPVVSIFNPAAGAIMTGITNSIVKAEVAFPDPKQGPVKAAAVVDEFGADISIAQEVLRAAGQRLTYDGGLLQDAIDKQLAALKAYDALKASMKIEKI